MFDFPIPVIGLCAYSGMGKTTLLSALLPILRKAGLRVGVVKHAHHGFDIDHEGGDSYIIRKAGAAQIAVASKNTMAFIEEVVKREVEPLLLDAWSILRPNRLDMVISEGFKRAPIPKIELYRPDLSEQPTLCEGDDYIIALTSDRPVKVQREMPQLNNVGQISEFILG